jgi:DNA-directed RNA polymerase specialized sigma24 family protein
VAFVSRRILSSPVAQLSSSFSPEDTEHGKPDTAASGDVEVLNSCLRRIRSWRVPPNWSAQDWFGEMQGQGAAALWQAKRDYDPTRGVPLSAFERSRVLAVARTRYRQEWRYALHCLGGAAEQLTDSEVEELSYVPPVTELLEEALAQLSESDRWLIEQLFWGGCSEGAAAGWLGISQQAVSKRRGAVLKKLRHLLGEPEISAKSNGAGCETISSLHYLK